MFTSRSAEAGSGRARNGVAQVQRCLDCDRISIHVGPLTFRLDPNSLEGLWTVLGDAAMALHVHRARGTSTARGTA